MISLLEKLARFGYGARGLVYILVGGLAVLAALGSGGQTTGSRGALLTVLGQPLGWVWLGIIGLGLASFALWRYVEAITDADRHGKSWKALGTRAVHIGSGFVHLGLAGFAITLALGWAATGGDENKSAKDWTSLLMAQPLGRWLVAGVGIAVAVGGLGFVWKAWRADFTKYLGYDKAKHWIVPLGRIGLVARGIVFCLIGGFLGLAALQGDPGEAQGLGGALSSLQQQPYGWMLLAATALGLGAYGLFGVAEAFYRRIAAPAALQRASRRKR